MFSMHTEHLANISKSVTKNATFPRTGGLPCLITRQLHVCCISYSFGGLIFCISATPQPGSLFPLFHDCWHVGSCWKQIIMSYLQDKNKRMFKYKILTCKKGHQTLKDVKLRPLNSEHRHLPCPRQHNIISLSPAVSISGIKCHPVPTHQFSWTRFLCQQAPSCGLCYLGR